MPKIHFKQNPEIYKEVSDPDYRAFLVWQKTAPYPAYLLKIKGYSLEKINSISEANPYVYCDGYCSYLLYEASGKPTIELKKATTDLLCIGLVNIGGVGIRYITLKGYENRIDRVKLREDFLKKYPDLSEFKVLIGDPKNPDPAFIGIEDAQQREEAKDFFQQIETRKKEVAAIVGPQFDRFVGEIGAFLQSKTGFFPEREGFIDWFINRYVFDTQFIYNLDEGSLEGIRMQEKDTPLIVVKNDLHEYCQQVKLDEEARHSVALPEPTTKKIPKNTAERDPAKARRAITRLETIIDDLCKINSGRRPVPTIDSITNDVLQIWLNEAEKYGFGKSEKQIGRYLKNAGYDQTPKKVIGQRVRQYFRDN